MLAITAKVRLLKEEVHSAKHYCRDIIGTLEGVTETTNFRDEIGIFAVQVPNWKILSDEKRLIVEVIRQICTGELSTDKAKIAFNTTLAELDKLDSWLQVPKK